MLLSIHRSHLCPIICHLESRFDAILILHLQDWMQLLDELSMVYLTSTNFYATFSFRRSPTFKALVLAFTISFSVGGTLYYHYLKDPVFHQNAFAILTATVILTNVYRMEILLRPTTTEKEELRERRAHTLKTMRAMVLCGVAAVAFAFTIWSLDNILCSHLRAWRRVIGLPWGIVLEGHGWWYNSPALVMTQDADTTRHIFTAISTRYILVWLTWLRYYQEGRQDDVVLEWPSYYTSLPLVFQKSVKAHSA